MKTLEELYQEILADKALEEEFKKALAEGTAEEFAKAHGCEDAGHFVMAQDADAGELPDEELDKVTGGAANPLHIGMPCKVCGNIKHFVQLDLETHRVMFTCTNCRTASYPYEK